MLDGLSILELGQGISAAYCTKLFADLGADVLKIELPAGDSLRARGPFPNDEPGLERSGVFAYVNTSKRGVTLDVTTARGRDLLFDLARDADVLVENNLPSWNETHGLTYDALRAINPRLIVTSITPFGQTGPWSHAQANEFIAQHTSGVAYNNGQKAQDLDAQPPIALPDNLGEYLGGIAGASGTMCAVWQREETNEGCQVDVAIQEALAMHLHLDLAWTTFAGTEISRAVGAQPAIQWVGQQPTSDGYIDFVIRTDEQWRNFVDVLGNPAWSENELFATTPSRARYWDGLEPLIQEELRGWKKDELFRAAQAKGVPAAPVHSVADAANAGHFEDRHAFVEHDHPELGRVRMPGPPVRFGVEAWALRSAAPSPGQHNRDVFVERLGMSDDELARLLNEGVV